MDFQRLILFVALSFTIMLLWSAWQRDYGPQPPQTVATQQASKAPAASDIPTSAPSTPQATGSDGPVVEAAPVKSGERIKVVTDLYDAEIDTIGGDLRRVELLKYPVAVDKPNEPTRLLDDGAKDFFIAQTALRGADKQSAAPDHYSTFMADAKSYTMQPGADTLSVPLHWKDENGVEVIKTYTFHRDRYVIDVDMKIRNGSEQKWQGYAYRQIQRLKPEGKSHLGSSVFTGAVISTDQKKYEKVSFDKMEEETLSVDAKSGWIAMMQHYFVSAWIPPKDVALHLYSKDIKNNRFVIGMTDQMLTIEPGKNSAVDASLYIGPKLASRMEKAAPNLELTVDYGWLTVISRPLFWLLEKIHGYVGNWGWAIILLTLLIKLAFFKLSAASYKSMAHMRQMQPKMQSIKERYADDRQKMNEAMMKLYKEEKINPLGGCLPILVQIPVFIALYYMLLENVELRQVPFMLWIKDLSIADPYYVLPLIMGVTMFIQQRLNPSPLDPIQARVMMVLPVVFTVFFIFFPAGLVLYWVVNNTLSIAQQWYITKVMMKA